MPVPISIIVCEGNIGTIAHISDALEQNIPVIIMKGSGKAADLVCDYLDKYVLLTIFEIEIQTVVVSTSLKFIFNNINFELNVLKTNLSNYCMLIFFYGLYIP